MSKLHAIKSGPSRAVQRTIAETKTLLRSPDIRAVAFVFVNQGGQVITGWAGREGGHHHQLASGIAALNHRFQNEVE